MSVRNTKAGFVGGNCPSLRPYLGGIKVDGRTYYQCANELSVCFRQILAPNGSGCSEHPMRTGNKDPMRKKSVSRSVPALEGKQP